MVHRKAIRYRDNATAWLSRKCGYCGFDVRGALHQQGHGFDREHRGGRLHGAEIQSTERRRLRIVNHGDTLDPWIDFLEQLQHLAADRLLEICKASDVSSRPR